jgi:hypothetical protein
MNSLEDAYINIAREEDRLLEQLKQKGILKMQDKRLSIQHNDENEIYQTPLEMHLKEQQELESI